MMNAGEFVPINGRGRKLLFDPDAIEAWIKSRQQIVIPAVSSPSPTKRKQLDKNRSRRLKAAREALERHRSPNQYHSNKQEQLQ